MGNDDTAMVTVPTENPWLRPEVADAQLELVTQQLADDAAGNTPPPFAAFQRAMDFLYARIRVATDNRRIGHSHRFLDIGCGVGHYGVLCKRYYHLIQYMGYDISKPMIARANELLAPLRAEGGYFCVIPNYPVASWRESLQDILWSKLMPHTDPFNVLYGDIVFVSQTVEVTDDPIGNLRMILERARKYVILHRLRIPPHMQGYGLGKNSTPTLETTYLGYAAANFLWNRLEVMQIVGEYGQVIYADEWDKLLTLIVEKP